MKFSPLLYRNIAVAFSAVVSLSGCGSAALVSAPIQNIDATPQKVAQLSEDESKRWGHADLTRDTIPGMSLDRAYQELLGSLKVREKVVVAVLDTGIDLEHEDLDGVLWSNEGEKPGNGVDDDNNGYVDDVHGYNFLGESFHEQLEVARILRLKIGDEAYQKKAQEVFNEQLVEASTNRDIYESYLEAVLVSDKAVKEYLGRDAYTQADIMEIQTTDPRLHQYMRILNQMFELYHPEPSMESIVEKLREGADTFNAQIAYNLNVDFDGREPVGDDPYDINDRGYGNGNPKNLDEESHGTHVAGIIAAERGNGLGTDGVADQVAIMSVRMLSDGDEYDKDVALGIRYAVDNGARIINASFGKAFSPNKEWVYEAIKYAAKKDVLIVHAAGNDGLDMDDPSNPNYPNDQVATGAEITDNVLTVGSLDDTYGTEMVSSFSNYGASNVDIFAPGGNIYSTMPGNNYEFQGGTSMAAPAVSGLAALILSRFPDLTAAQVKKIIMQSGLAVNKDVVLAGDEDLTRPFDEICRSGKIANAYNALILADQVSNGKISL